MFIHGFVVLALRADFLDGRLKVLATDLHVLGRLDRRIRMPVPGAVAPTCSAIVAINARRQTPSICAPLKPSVWSASQAAVVPSSTGRSRR